jgi:hypothetical protein
LRAGEDADEDEDDDEEEDDDAPDDIEVAPPPSADFADGEISGSFAPMAAVATQQQAIRVRKVRMKYPEV